jgi:choline dehydrogenase-like flavoprotein
VASGALVQARDVEGRARVDDEADVAIVGSGAGGATAARVLAEAGLDVVIVEEGPSVPTPERTVDAYSSFKRLWRDAGFQVARGRAFVPILQGSCVGGSTTINGAIIHRMPESIFATWARGHGVGARLRYDDLAAAWDRLDDELGVAPAPEAALGQNNRLMREGTRALGIEGHPIARNVRGCQASARCTQGCPTGRKQSMEQSYVPRAIAAGARLYADCRVDRLVLDRGRATGLRGRFAGPRGGELRVRARSAVVVAASAVQTPILLEREGVGRQSGLVGRRFQAHPATSVLGLFDAPVDLWTGATQGFETMEYWHAKRKFETASVPLEILAARLPGYGAELVRALADARHVAQWGVEVRAEAHGRVRRGWGGKASVAYDPTDHDVRLLKEGIKTLARLLFAAGAREVMPGVHGLPARAASLDEVDRIDRLPDDPRLFHLITGHVFGTAVMGSNPRTSVVSPEGESHEVTGLYVMDASVFPTNIGVNPQHAICGLAWVMAERLAERCLGRARGA